MLNVNKTLFYLAFVGFPLSASLTILLSLPMSYMSILFKFIVAFVGSFFILRSILSFRGKVNFYVFMFLCFWVFYFIRIFYDTIIVDDMELGRPGWFYWVWGLLVCFVPSLSIIVSKKLDVESLSLSILFFIVSLIILLIGKTTWPDSSGMEQEISRLNLTTLNPISAGHVGASLALLSILRLVSMRGNFLNIKSAYDLIALTIGLAVMLLAVSLGAIVSFVVSAGIFILFYFRFRVFFFSFLFFSGCLFLLFNVHEELFYRLFDIGSRSSVIGRVEMYNSAIQGFLDSPIFGLSLEEPIHKFSVHNIFLESLMAIGLFSMPLFIVAFRAIYLSIRLIREKSKFTLIAVLFFQYLVGSLFSGGVVTNYPFWILLGALLFISSKHGKPYYER
jgi:hypothetical protein